MVYEDWLSICFLIDKNPIYKTDKQQNFDLVNQAQPINSFYYLPFSINVFYYLLISMYFHILQTACRGQWVSLLAYPCV